MSAAERGDDGRRGATSTADDFDDRTQSVSLPQLFRQYRWRILATWFLVVLEAGLMLMFPLAIGIAIDGLLERDWHGVGLLGVTGVLTVFTGAARRFYDTRIYSRIYAAAAEQIVTQERGRQSKVSVISARTGMATELVEFLENSLPAIIDCVIGIVGALIMIWLLQVHVFVGCLIGSGIIIAIYALTQERTFLLNRGLNDESEKSVDVLGGGAIQEVSSHFRRMMTWNIRLSDLETAGFSVSWLVMIGVLLFAVVATVQGGVTAHGQVLSILMYVFGYIESVIALPLFYQQFVRLQEISGRL